MIAGVRARARPGGRRAMARVAWMPTVRMIP
jgi:hypothetical protein